MSSDSPSPMTPARAGVSMVIEPDHTVLAGDMAGRAHQAFPVPKRETMEHLPPCGRRQRWHDGDWLLEAGKPGPGMLVWLSGQVAATRRDGLGHDLSVAREAPGEFLAEVGQRSGQPALADGRARGEGAALLIAPERPGRRWCSSRRRRRKCTC